MNYTVSKLILFLFLTVVAFGQNTTAKIGGSVQKNGSESTIKIIDEQNNSLISKQVNQSSAKKIKKQDNKNPQAQQIENKDKKDISEESIRVTEVKQISNEEKEYGQLQIKEQEEHEKNIQNIESELQPWIAQEIRESGNLQQGIVTQSLAFVIDPSDTIQFKWNPPKNKQLLLSVIVYLVNENGQLSLVTESNEQQFIEIEERNFDKGHYSKLGRVYISKVFSLNFDADYKFIKFTSKLERSVIISVDLERLDEVVPNEGIVKDDHLDLSTKKLIAIQNQLVSEQKLREHTYKYEWGFLQKIYEHDSKLLGMTGVELLVIISCSFVQIFFIKGLLDNRAVI